MLFPGSLTQGRPSAVFTPPEGSRLVELTSAQGERVAALYGKSLVREGVLGTPRHRPTILLFYGNGTWLKTAQSLFRTLRRAGADVLVLEYVGYGLSSGKASEQGCYRTADAGYQYVTRELRVPPDRIIAAGYSLGAAVAIDLAARRPVAGLATFNAFSSMEEMARRRFAFAPVALLRHRFRSDLKMGRIHVPALLVSGSRDALVDPAMSDLLAARAAGPIQRLRVEAAEHNDVFEVAGDEVLAGLEKLCTPVISPSPSPIPAALRHSITPAGGPGAVDLQSRR
jgi:pimeloyl-ACP methyl ester carboxylesterase